MGTQFPTFQDFIKAVERRGVGAMEIVAMDMKLRGMYTARQLSFAGVKFSINEVPLSADFVDMYNASVKLWVEARKLFQEASDLMDFDRKKLKPMWSQFWAAHQVRTKLNLHEVLGYELFSISKKKDFYCEFIRYISI